MISLLSDVLRKLPEARRINAPAADARNEQRYAKQRATVKAWATANPERLAELARKVKRKRASLLRVAIARSTPDEQRAVKAQLAAWRTFADWTCHYCGCTGAHVVRTSDHVIPLTKGGEHTLANLVPACRTCNSRKATLALA